MESDGAFLKLSFKLISACNAKSPTATRLIFFKFMKFCTCLAVKLNFSTRVFKIF
jgi:hypothetical protein